MSRSRLFRVSADGKQADVRFLPEEAQLLRDLGIRLRMLLTIQDDTNQTAALFPPAYGDDFMRQVEYDRTSRGELSDSHVQAIDAMLHMLDCERADADQVDAFARAVNQLRLVAAQKLQITAETDDDDFPEDHEDHHLYMAFHYLAVLQREALEILMKLQPFEEPGDEDTPLA